MWKWEQLTGIVAQQRPVQVAWSWRRRQRLLAPAAGSSVGGERALDAKEWIHVRYEAEYLKGGEWVCNEYVMSRLCCVKRSHYWIVHCSTSPSLSTPLLPALGLRLCTIANPIDQETRFKTNFAACVCKHRTISLPSSSPSRWPGTRLTVHPCRVPRSIAHKPTSPSQPPSAAAPPQS